VLKIVPKIAKPVQNLALFLECALFCAKNSKTGTENGNQSLAAENIIKSEEWLPMSRKQVSSEH
jgi:hypothetical protein